MQHDADLRAFWRGQDECCLWVRADELGSACLGMYSRGSAEDIRVIYVTCLFFKLGFLLFFSEILRRQSASTIEGFQRGVKHSVEMWDFQTPA